MVDFGKSDKIMKISGKVWFSSNISFFIQEIRYKCLDVSTFPLIFITSISISI